MTVVGRGGVGKTALVCRLLKALEAGRLPDGLGQLPVDGIVYLSPAGTHPVSFPNLFADLCRLLPPPHADRLLQRYRDPRETPAGLTLALLDAFPAGRVVVLLDQAEDLIDADGFALADAPLDAALKALLSAPAHGVRVIVTSRVAPRELLLAQPARQRRLDLDEGLDSPYAEQVLRASDPDGRLGLKTAPEELLSQARLRTRGYPRALEALAAILSADRDTTLPDLLAQTARLPENVIEALVGEAFNRLDPLAQQVMQALAVYPVPVPPVAVDYLLQPHRPTIDAAQALGRLVNMHFARRDAGRYYLHQVDRDYALSRIPAGQRADRDLDPPPFTRHGLRDRAADYFKQTRTPREDWKSLDDLAPQLAEFDLRCQGEDHDTAAQVLLGVGFDYLIRWGHYRLAIDLHERLQGHLTDPQTNAAIKSNLGLCYADLGQTTRAIDHHQQALTIARDIGHRQGEAANLGNLGHCYAALGQTTRAIEHYQQALTIARDIGDRAGEAADLGNLGLRYAELGQTTRAIDHHQQALTIARDIGHRRGEAASLGSLGLCYADLGQTTRAIEHYQQALTIARDIGYRRGEAAHLGNLGLCYADLGQTTHAIEHHQQALTIDRDIGYRAGEALDLVNLGDAHGVVGEWEQAGTYARQAIEVADAIGFAQAQSEARVCLARICLLADDLPAAQDAARDARNHAAPRDKAMASLLLGIAQLRQGTPTPAAHAFAEATAHADELLRESSHHYAALDTKALARCGLALTQDASYAAQAIAVFRQARAITTDNGTVTQVLRLFDAIAAADPAGTLTPVSRVVFT
jgi:tetratricopeptide (TPR) repeat protein